MRLFGGSGKLICFHWGSLSTKKKVKKSVSGNGGSGIYNNSESDIAIRPITPLKK
jgi:hypothetical protein